MDVHTKTALEAISANAKRLVALRAAAEKEVAEIEQGIVKVGGKPLTDVEKDLLRVAFKGGAVFGAGAAKERFCSDPVGEVCRPNESRPYNHFIRLREPRDNEIGAKLYAIHDL